MRKEFNGLLISEVRKAERCANKATGTNDCKLTGYFWDGNYELMSETDPNSGFVTVRCEICHRGEERTDFDVELNIPMFDRRSTFAAIV